MFNIISKVIKSITIILISITLFFLLLSQVGYKVNTYKITKNDKVIIFQEMVHFGEANYYNSVNKDIDNYKKENFTLLYEEIKVENSDDKKEMVKNLGLDIDLFSKIALSTGLDSQHNYMTSITDKDINADITAKQLNANFKNINNRNESDINIANNILSNLLSNVDLNNKITNFISKNIMKLGLFINSYFNIQDPSLDLVIIKQRNDVLIDYINKTEGNLYIQYGQLHFNDFESKMKADGYVVEIIDRKQVFK